MRNLRPREIFFLITVPQILIMWKVRYPLQMQGSASGGAGRLTSQRKVFSDEINTGLTKRNGCGNVCLK